MSFVAKIYRDLKGDRAIWIIVAVLTVFSVLTVYSASGSLAYQLSRNTEYYLMKQVVVIALGLGLTYICYQLNYLKYSRIAPLLLLISIPLLMYTFFFGNAVNDARRWIEVPLIGLTFQTSDFAKLALIIYLARSISSKQDNIKDFGSAFVPLIVPVCVICFLIAPSDLSTAALLFMTCLIMMFIGRVHIYNIGVLFLFGIVLLALIIILGQFFPEFVRVETWTTRLTDFFTNSDGDYQIRQAKIAIADGGWFGVGPGNSIQRNYLPYAYADFIYAIICEEYGLLGGFVILGMYLWLFFRCAAIVTKCPKAFGAILAIGLCLNIVIQAFANIAVSVHMVPVTGLTLPLVSYGGSSILVTCISFGIILSVSKYIEHASMNKLEFNEVDE